jgi:uncharacterized protein YccT (UPF0319 family)
MKKFIAISLLSIVSSVSMAATISLPDNLIFTAVDGKTVQNKSQIDIAPGQHLIQIQYYDVFRPGVDDTDIIKSDALYWIYNLAKDEDIQVKTKEVLSSTSAKNFIKSPLITLDRANIKGETVKLVNHEELMAIIMKQHSKMMQQ